MANGLGEWLLDKLKELGVDISWQTKLQHLIVKDGRVVGVQLEDLLTTKVNEIMANKGVILCTGGYGANKALMQKWNPTLLKSVVYSDSQRDDGSGVMILVITIL